MTVENGAVVSADVADDPVAKLANEAISTAQYPNAALPSPGTPGAYVQATASTVATASMQVAVLAGPGMVKADMLTLFRGWVHGTHTSPEHGPDELAWFLSKNATALINTWLNNKRLSGLHVNARQGGAIVIPRDRAEHARDSRTNKDSVGLTGVEELFAALFVHGTPKYAPHPDSKKYPNQLLMFDPLYKSTDATASGESPVAALQFIGTPVAHLRLETAYWAGPAKTKALEAQALKK